MENNNKNTARRKITLKFVFFLSLAIISSIPIIIVVSYSSDVLPSSVDMLMYFGTTVSGLATLFAVFIAFGKEKEFQGEEKTHNARVFIVMDSNILFFDFNDFCKYSRDAKISKLYCFPDWLPANDRELP